MKKIVVLLPLAVACATATTVLRQSSTSSATDPIYIPASPQRSGDSAKGYGYLVTGDYIKSGIPLPLYQFVLDKDTNNFLHRKGGNKDIPYNFTAVKAPNSEIVIAPNCLQCHAQMFDSKLVVGLGNTTTDYSHQEMLSPQMVASVEQMLKVGNAKQYEAAEPLFRAVKVIGDRLITKVRGVNPADGLTAILAAHRDPRTLRWRDSALLRIPDKLVPSDVPAWWLMKKKHAMFYTGVGRGDLGRFMMASNLLTANDTAEANEVDGHFNDVLTYITSLQSPQYPRPINKQVASIGREIYLKNCSGCHGNRGLNGDYPNLLIPGAIIKTDSLLFVYQQNAPYLEWGNSSWFTQGDHPARLVPSRGYVAPPLDGIWITAPYLHNGSVPTLEGVLSSKDRPKYWSRDFDNPSYDYTAVGWHYTVHETPGSSAVYNTTLPGYGNQGHEFGDKLTKEERKAVIEYLKTL